MTEVVPRASDSVRDMTVYSLLPLWMDNLAANLSWIRGGRDAQTLPKGEGPAIIVGAGPSLSVFKHLQQIKRSNWKHALFVCDKKLEDALRLGLKPNYAATVDGSPTIANFFNRKLVKKHAKDITGVFNVLTHPRVIELWRSYGGNPYWFVSMMDDPDERGKIGVRSLTSIMYYLSGKKGIISGIGNVGSFCFHPETLVLTSSGMKSIDTIDYGDLVLVKNGRWEAVQQLHVHPYSGTMLKIFLRGFGNLPLIVTPEHEFIIRSENNLVEVEAKSLTKTDYLTIPFGNLYLENEAIDTYEVLSRVSPKSVERKRKVALALNREILKLSLTLNINQIAEKLHVDWHHVKAVLSDPDKYTQKQKVIYRPKVEGDRVRFTFGRTSVPRTLCLTPDLCRLIGYYLAEGSTTPSSSSDDRKRLGYKLSWAFGSNMREQQYIQDVSSLANKFFDVTLTSTDVDGKTYLSTGNNALALLFRLLFGVGAAGKKLPHYFLNLSCECLEQLLIGWLRGDGYSKQLAGTTVSETLAYQLMLLSLKAGFTPSLHQEKKSKSRAYRLRFTSSLRRDWLAEQAFGLKIKPPNFKWHPRTCQKTTIDVNVPIAKIEQISYNGPVYNLGTYETHSYTANLVSVSNCWNLAAALNYSPIILVGFDFSEQVLDKADAVYFDFYVKWFLQGMKMEAGNVKLSGDAMDKAAALHQLEENPDFTSSFNKKPYYRKGKPPVYLVNPIWKYYRDALAMHIVSSKIHTINATQNGCIHTHAKNDKDEYILKVPNFESKTLAEVLEKYG